MSFMLVLHNNEDMSLTVASGSTCTIIYYFANLFQPLTPSSLPTYIMLVFSVVEDERFLWTTRFG